MQVGAERSGVDQQLVQGLIDGSPNVVYAKDAERRYILANRRLGELLGADPAELIGKTDEALLPAAEAARARASDERVLETREPDFEEQVVGDGGGRIHLSTKFPLFDERGEMVGIGGISTDITDQVEAKRRAQRQGERQAVVAALGTSATLGVPLQELAEEAVNRVAEVMEADFAKVLELNRDGSSLLLQAAYGFGEDQVGKASVPATGETQAGFTLQQGKAVVVEDLSRESRFRGADLLHDHHVVSGISTVIRGDGNAIPGVYGVVSAHTAERRDFEAEDVDFLDAVATVLATAIARERGNRLERQLNQAQRLESLGQLAGGIAHDFNNLLAVIINYAAFLEDALSDQDAGVKEDIREIRKAADRAADLTRQLLVFSRRQVTQTEVFDANAVIEDAETLLRRTIGEDVELIVDLERPLPTVRMGQGQLEQMLMNLCLNARDAMPGGGTLTLRSERVEFARPLGTSTGELAPGEYVQLTVSDSGTGMTREHAAQIFEPFFTTKSEHGTGLGLATVYGIVRDAGGQIQVYSEVGKGTVFKVYLPASDQPAGGVRDLGKADVAAGGEKIVVVEDEAPVRRLTCRILEQHGYAVEEAPTPQEALEICRRDSVDLLLTDVIMPEMSGRELAAQARASHPDLKILFMSGYTGDIISRHGMIGDDLMVIEKPFSGDGLLRRVREVLDG